MRNNKVLQYTPAEKAVLTTILYSDIFSFPLTKDELWKFLISPEKLSKQTFVNALRSLNNQVSTKEGFYCLKGREAIFSERKQKEHEVAKKMKLASMVTERLIVFPSIVFIGISGGLAVGNVTEKDDIDFVVITKKNTLFTTRLLILGVLEVLGIRRFRNQQDASDTICVNLLFDESSLTWPENKRDLYTAREIAQINPLFEREQMYKRFLNANKWIIHFLPNVVYQKPLISKNRKKIIGKILNSVISNSISEYLTRFLQMGLMRRHQTKEIVTNHFLAFHPNDYRTKTLTQLKLKMRQFGLLTKF